MTTTRTELDQLRDLFEDRPEAELKSILDRHGGDVNSAVEAICNGEQGVGSFPHVDAAAKNKTKNEETKGYLPPKISGYRRKDEPASGTAQSNAQDFGGVGQFGSLSSNSRRKPHRRRGAEEVDDDGSMPPSMAGTASVTTTSSASTSETETMSAAAMSGATGGDVAGSTANRSAPVEEVGAFAIPGIGVSSESAQGQSVPVQGHANASHNSVQEGATVVASAVVRDDLADDIRAELRSEFREELRNMAAGAAPIASAEVVGSAAPITSAEVIVPQRGDEETGTSHLTGDTTPPKKPFWKSKWLWVAATVLLLGAVGGLVGAMFGSQGDSTSQTSNVGGGAGASGITNAPSVAPPPTTPAPFVTFGPAPTLPSGSPAPTLPIGSPAPTLPIGSPAPTLSVGQTTATPTIAPVDDTPAPTPIPATDPPVEGPTPPPTPRPSPKPTGNPTRRPTDNPTPRPTEQRRTPCTDEYGSDILVCSETPTECLFYVKLGGRSCRDYCSSQGGSCLFGIANDRDDLCKNIGANSCDEGFNDNLCICTLGDAGEPPTRNPTRRPTSNPTRRPVDNETPRPTPRPSPRPTDKQEEEEKDCKDKYGSGIKVCNERSSECTFFVVLNDKSCDDYCEDRGGRCRSAEGNKDEGDGRCVGENSHSCSAGRRDTICTCTL